MEVNIVKSLSNSTGMMFTDLQKELEISSQRLTYYLRKLLGKGIIFKENRYYHTQLAFKHFDEIIDELSPFLKSFANHISVNGKHDPESVMTNCLELFFETYIFEIQK